MIGKTKTLSWMRYMAIAVILLIPMACGFGTISITQPSGSNSPFSIATQPSSDGPSANAPVIPDTSGGASDGAVSNDNTSTGNANMGNVAAAPQKAPANLEELYKQVNPGAVSIQVQVTENGQTGEAAGSGFIITDTGYIATNNHVVQGATQVYVTFFNQVILPAKVVGVDPNSDLAVIKVDKLPQDTHPLPMGDSDKVLVGDSVVAIGNPFALGTSMTSGIISAVGRVIPSLTDYTIPSAIQTDAAINPGNSGGPLLNMNGEVIGIDAQIQTSTQGGGNVGIGFAIPVNILKEVYPSLIQTGTYTWPYLGVSGGAINPQAAQQLGLDVNQRGAYIASVVAGGPAEKAGLRKGDIVTQADGKTINTFDDILTYVAFKRPGDKVKLTVLRGSSQTEVTVTLGNRPKSTSSQTTP